MKILAKFEELVLIAVLQPRDRAYEIPIYEHIVRKTGNGVSVSRVYFPLERRVRKGYLNSLKARPLSNEGACA